MPVTAKQLGGPTHSKGAAVSQSGTRRQQFSHLLVFLAAVLFFNLYPLRGLDRVAQPADDTPQPIKLDAIKQHRNHWAPDPFRRSTVDGGVLNFVALMFTNPMGPLLGPGARVGRGVLLAEARVIGKMAKMWYIKKKIKKLSKKLKKHTIAVPVFTAIPIYEHSYYPQPHVTHMSHGGLHHAAAASSYAPVATQMSAAQALAAAAAATSPSAQISPSSASVGQLATAASSTNPQMAAYRPPGPTHGSTPTHHPHQHPAMYNPTPMASNGGAHHIINAYQPSPPLYVDDAGGLYGHYGNAYGRYDGGYHIW